MSPAIDSNAAQQVVWAAELNVFTDDQWHSTGPVIVRSGQVAVGAVYRNSATGRVGRVEVDVFDLATD